MITMGIIRNGARYLSRHLRKNDYWSEGEKEVEGNWAGEVARLLDLEGAVRAKQFEALRMGRDPRTRLRLNTHTPTKRVAFFDVQISAPKDVSVLGVVASDERVRREFYAAARVAVSELERWAAVRERRGKAHNTEAVRLTRNLVAALFLHDASRDLDPQLHVHAVIANVTWDAERQVWMALQPAEMMRASRFVRQAFYRELAGRMTALGYRPHDMSSRGFAVAGVEHLRERFSKRSRHVERLAEEFAREHGRKPSKREVQILVRDSRDDKLTEVNTAEVRQRQRAELSETEQRELDDLVQSARESPDSVQISHGAPRVVLDSAIRHVFERCSVAREGDVLAAALELHPDFYRWRELREALDVHPDAVRREGEMTLKRFAAEESRAAQRVREGKNTRPSLGDPHALPATLMPGQRSAAGVLLSNRDFVAVLIGDAGTGKTTVLSAIEAAHVGANGKQFVSLAPTTRARDALIESGFAGANTVQRFLMSEADQRAAAGRVLLVDEAGLLSSQQMDQLTAIAVAQRARLLLVGDTKQHQSVERGDALRGLVERAGVASVRLSEVLRQRGEGNRKFSRLLADGQTLQAMLHAERRGLMEQVTPNTDVFAEAAKHYAEAMAAGDETLVVIPFWEEIGRFNQHARQELRKRGLLEGEDIERESLDPLSWTDEQKMHWDQYRIGDRLLFVRPNRLMGKGSSGEVVDVLKDGLQIRDCRGVLVKVTKRYRTTFEVGRRRTLALAAGDRVLIRGGYDPTNLRNGDLKVVHTIDPNTKDVRFTDGSEMPAEFESWTYGHAVTSYRAQGSTAESSLLVLGETSERLLTQRQFYVANTRFRGAHRILVANRDAIFQRLQTADRGRELATEFLNRPSLSETERVIRRHLQRAGQHVQAAWQAIVHRWHEMIGRTAGERQEV